jgi:hypothetical protein
MEGDIQSQKDPVIQKTLEAIDRGVVDGDDLMVGEVNSVLLTYGVSSFTYGGMMTLVDNGDIKDPDVGGDPTCPYVGPKPVSGTDTGAQSCSYLAEEASEAAQLALEAVDPNAAIEPEFAEDSRNISLYRSWYANGANSAVGISVQLLAGTLRDAGACDNNPSPATAAYTKGVELGRQLYIKAMNERLKQIGIDFDYPNGSNPSRSIRYCKANLRDPVIQDANAKVQSAVAEAPLCDGIAGDPIEQSGYYDQYQQVEEEYEEGVLAGVMKEDELAQGILKGGGVCIASPLVLDLGGDGIALGGSARFDLLAEGRKVESSWIKGDDALLVRDVDGSGRIEDATELFGNDATHANGFDNLATHDDNGDGVIDAQDAIYAELRLWQDRDGDGVSTPDELSELAGMGVKAIQLSYTESGRVDRHGNQLRQTGKFVRTADFAGALGDTGAIVDVWFSYR